MLELADQPLGAEHDDRDDETLVVDDDFRVSHIHSQYVTRVEGYEVVGRAATVAEALDGVRTLHPDLLLLDVFLPDGSGLDVLRQLTGDTGGARPDTTSAGRPSS